MSDSLARQAADEAITIAAGLPRAEVEQRARRAFDSANDIRARLRGLPDTAKRAHAASLARTWADILQHMDNTGEAQFCGCLHDATPPAIVRAVWILWDRLAGPARLLNAAALARGYQDVLGAKPITFYQWPEPEPGTGDGDAFSPGRLQQSPALPAGQSRQDRPACGYSVRPYRDAGLVRAGLALCACRIALVCQAARRRA